MGAPLWEPLTSIASLRGPECSTYPEGGGSVYNNLGVWQLCPRSQLGFYRFIQYLHRAYIGLGNQGLPSLFECTIGSLYCQPVLSRSCSRRESNSRQQEDVNLGKGIYNQSEKRKSREIEHPRYYSCTSYLFQVIPSYADRGHLVCNNSVERWHYREVHSFQSKTLFIVLTTIYSYNFQ